MTAHTGIVVSDIETSKNFYIAALRPIGYQKLPEYGITATLPAASAGFAAPPRADLWLYQGIPGQVITHVAFQVDRRNLVDEFYAAASPPAAETTANQNPDRNMAPTTMVPIC